MIPNWNGKEYLKVCLDSLLRSEKISFDILVVDNGSEDGSLELLREQYPSVRLISLPENRGFTGAVNLGVSESETEFVLLLNNDTEVTPDFVFEMHRAISESEKIFSVSARMVSYRNREILDDCGDFYTVLGYQFQKGTGQSVSDRRYLKKYRVFSACGGAAIYRRDLFLKLGSLDPSHFAYLEDVDLGYRANLYGYRNMYAPLAVVYHVGSAASGATKYSDFKVRLSARNNQYLIFKNMFLPFRILNALPLFAGRKVKGRFFEKEGFPEAYRQGILEGREKKKELKKVPCTPVTFFNSIKIEGRLIHSTVVYVFEYLRRKKRKNAS